MEVDIQDKPPEEKNNSNIVKIGLVLGLIGILILYALGAFDDRFRAIEGRDILYRNIYDKYRIPPLPLGVFFVDGVDGQMKILDKDPCKSEAINDIARFMSEAGFKRDAVVLLRGYAEACPDSVWQLIYAGSYLYELGEYAEALKVAELAVHLNPSIFQGIYLRARTLRKLDRHKEAVSFYEDLIKKFNVQRELGIDIFNEMAMSYASLGDYCEAATTLQTYVAFNKKERDTEAIQREIRNYEEEGKCNTKPIIVSEKLERSDGIFIVDAYVNDVRGKFIVDTGASFVALTPEFARRADVSVTGEKVSVDTANGSVTLDAIILDFVALRGVSAKQVLGTILNKPMQKGIDGLLGMSFLSRFAIAVRGDVIIITQTWNPSSVPEARSENGNRRKVTHHQRKKRSRR